MNGESTALEHGGGLASSRGAVNSKSSQCHVQCGVAPVQKEMSIDTNDNTTYPVLQKVIASLSF